jgi:hypothetical protein
VRNGGRTALRGSSALDGKRRAALVLSLKGETTAAGAVRRHGLKVAEVEEWRERFLLVLAATSFTSCRFPHVVMRAGSAPRCGPSLPFLALFTLLGEDHTASASLNLWPAYLSRLGQAASRTNQSGSG